MANLGSGFNVNDLPQDTGGFEPLPAGEYQVNIGGAELCNTKAGTGQYINLALDVIGPTHQGRKLWAKLNIRNPSAKAEEIGRSQLNSVMRAIGLVNLSDTDELIGGKLTVKVTIKDDEYGRGNEVKAYKAIGGSAAPVPAAATASAPAKAAPPWAKK